jgi:hypothetical protein
VNKKRIVPKAKGHRRQYIPQNRHGFYEIIKLRSAALKFERWRAAHVVSLINAAKTTVGGTTTHKQVAAMITDYRGQIGWLASMWLAIEIFFARMFSEKKAVGFNQHVRSVFERVAFQKAA